MNLLNKYSSYLKSPHYYSAFVGLVLFLTGLLGFAFRGDGSLPDLVLFVSLILGIWGILVTLSKK